jgi:hypothetical protein
MVAWGAARGRGRRRRRGAAGARTLWPRNPGNRTPTPENPPPPDLGVQPQQFRVRPAVRDAGRGRDRVHHRPLRGAPRGRPRQAPRARGQGARGDARREGRGGRPLWRRRERRRRQGAPGGGGSGAAREARRRGRRKAVLAAARSVQLRRGVWASAARLARPGKDLRQRPSQTLAHHEPQAAGATGAKVLSFEALEASGRTGPAAAPEPPAPEDLSTIMYTSGTTGEWREPMITSLRIWRVAVRVCLLRDGAAEERPAGGLVPALKLTPPARPPTHSPGNPKGVLLTHRALVAAIAACNAYLEQYGEAIGEDDCYFSFLPLAHVFDRCAILTWTPDLGPGPGRGAAQGGLGRAGRPAHAPSPSPPPPHPPPPPTPLPPPQPGRGVCARQGRPHRLLAGRDPQGPRRHRGLPADAVLRRAPRV